MISTVKVTKKKSSTPALVDFDYVRSTVGVYIPECNPHLRVVTVVTGVTFEVDEDGCGMKCAYPREWNGKKLKRIEDEEITIVVKGKDCK